MSWLFGGKEKDRKAKQEHDRWRQEQINKFEKMPQYMQEFALRGIKADKLGESGWAYRQGRIDTFEALRSLFTDMAREFDDDNRKQCLLEISCFMDNMARDEKDAQNNP